VLSQEGAYERRREEERRDNRNGVVESERQMCDVFIIVYFIIFQ